MIFEASINMTLLLRQAPILQAAKHVISLSKTKVIGFVLDVEMDYDASK